MAFVAAVVIGQMDRSDPVAERPDEVGVALQKQVVRVEADHDLGTPFDQAEHLGRGAADAVGHVFHTQHRTDLFRRERQPADGVGGTAFAFAALLLRNGPRSGMQHQPLGTEDGGQPDHPFDIGHIPLTLFGIDDRDVAIPAERQVARPDREPGLVEHRLDAVGAGVALVLGGVAPEVVEDDLHVVDARGFDLREFFGLGDLHHAERYAHGVFGPGGSGGQQERCHYEQ